MDPASKSPRERLYEAFYEASYKRVKRRGLSDGAAVRIAGEVAKRAAERAKAPDLVSQDELAGTVYAVCKALGEGKSYYGLMGERPYLVTGRIDRLVGAAAHVRPGVPADMALAAKRATALERISGGLAVVFTAIALAAVGVWCALVVGLLVSAGTEVYVQMGMSPAMRKTAARYHLPRWLGLLALVMLLWTGYSRLGDSEYPFVTGSGLAIFALLVVAVVPGFTLAILVGLRERRWRVALEKDLVAAESGDPES